MPEQPPELPADTLSRWADEPPDHDPEFLQWTYWSRCHAARRLLWCEARRVGLEAEVGRLRAAIQKHHEQRADDRCWEDDDWLYAAAGLPPGDHRVGDREAMLANCERFLKLRCINGGWPTYAELEAEIVKLRAQVAGHCERIAKQSELLSRRAERREGSDAR